MERETRFELATPTLARLCSTPELFPHFVELKWNDTIFLLTCQDILKIFISLLSSMPLSPILEIYIKFDKEIGFIIEGL